VTGDEPHPSLRTCQISEECVAVQAYFGVLNSFFIVILSQNGYIQLPLRTSDIAASTQSTSYNPGVVLRRQ
jgi:hypothetical protein